MNNKQENNVMGSDGRVYTVEAEKRVPYRDVHLHIKVSSITLPYDNYLNCRREVERYISSVRDQYEPSKEELYSILNQLNTAIINNHFDYLALLQRVLPRLEKLMQ